MGAKIKAVFLDLSGVVYEGNTPIPGAVEAIQALRAQNLALRFVTNTATQASTDIIKKLSAMGIEVSEQELFTAPIAAKEYLISRDLRPFLLVHQAIKTQFADIDQRQPNCVLLGDARDDLSYDNLNIAFRLCQQGAPLIGIGMNKYFKEEDGLKLDAGAFIHAIEWAADAKGIIMGKPSKAFYQQVMDSVDFKASECLMVGDDVTSDVAGAIDAGLNAVLVQTGKYQEKDNKLLPTNAELLNSLVDLPSYLQTRC